VRFASERQRAGHSKRQAMQEASGLRLRTVPMTTTATSPAWARAY
jgi:multidrug efflux pump